MGYVHDAAEVLADLERITNKITKLEEALKKGLTIINNEEPLQIIGLGWLCRNTGFSVLAPLDLTHKQAANQIVTFGLNVESFDPVFVTNGSPHLIPALLPTGYNNPSTLDSPNYDGYDAFRR